MRQLDSIRRLMHLRCIVASLALMGSASAADALADTCALTIALVDAETGHPLPGVVQLRDAEGKLVRPVELLDRGLGLAEDDATHQWSVLPAAASTVQVSREKLTLRCFSGLETELAEVVVDLTGRATSNQELKIRRFYDARKRGWQAANTHVHLKRTSKAETERYLIECAKADCLDIVFVSYLERPSEHVHYSTNNYTREQLIALSDDHTHFDHGEEHRHNFTPWDEGYGHVMLLNIPELIKPVSLGPGITDRGTDGTPLRVGIDKARSFDGRIIWCHNTFGLEDIPSWLTGRLDANNIFDGGTHGSYRHSFYRYLNIGLRVPFSTGTDWFIYDFSRVYVNHPTRLSPEDWLNHLSQSRSYISNGPLLEFTVDGNTLGSDLLLEETGSVRVIGHAAGRVDFERLELVRNGEVIATVPSHQMDGHYRSEMNLTVQIDEPAWLALRTPPPSAPKMGMTDMTPLNEYGRELFSHTSAIFVDVAGQRIFKRAIAEGLIEEMRRNRSLIYSRGTFADAAEREQVISLYDDAIAKLMSRIEQ